MVALGCRSKPPIPESSYYQVCSNSRPEILLKKSDQSDLYWRHEREFATMNESTAAERIRTVIWDDPMISARAAPTMGGLEYLQAMQRGELPAPPIKML
jgi:hypothetical protein